jgi:hypothetical protein
MREFHRAGLELSDADREKLVGLRSKLTELQTKYAHHLEEDSSNIEVAPKELDGVPPALISRLKKAKNGDVIVTLSVPSTAVTSGGVSGSSPVTAQQMDIIRNGGAYLNIHTTNHPDGEIRAQIRSSFYGFQCRGADRPEALNPLIDCGNGVRQDELVNY